MITISKQANKTAIYCIIIFFILIVVLGIIDSFTNNYYHGYIVVFRYILCASSPFLVYWASIKLPNPEGIDDVSFLPNTKDIRVSSYSTKIIFIDSDNSISFVRFFFDDEIIYMYFRSFLKVYQGPFIIKKNEKAELNTYFIKSIGEFKEGNLSLEISPKNKLKEEYKLSLSNLSEEDFTLINYAFS